MLNGIFNFTFLEHSHREIRVDSYDVTIFPAENTKNTVSKKAKLKSKNQYPIEDDKYGAWFFDLAGTVVGVYINTSFQGIKLSTTVTILFSGGKKTEYITTIL